MAKDLIIGAFKNYSYSTISPWINSINESGFDGEKVLISINASEETNKKIQDAGFKVIPMTEQSSMMFHMERFYHIYNYLKDKKTDYRFVITTDVRDVVFQSNPSERLSENLVDGIKMIASSEAIQIKNESWNRDNILKCFGPVFYDDIKDKDVLNVGTLSGYCEFICDLCGMLFQMSSNRADWVADQAAYNVIMRWSPYNTITKVATLHDSWTCNLHVTNKPDQLHEFGPYLLDERPIMEEGLVKDGKFKKPFVIVHQYDRVPEWKKIIDSKYKTEEEPVYFVYHT